MQLVSILKLLMYFTSEQSSANQRLFWLRLQIYCTDIENRNYSGENGKVIGVGSISAV